MSDIVGLGIGDMEAFWNQQHENHLELLRNDQEYEELVPWMEHGDMELVLN